MPNTYTWKVTNLFTDIKVEGKLKFVSIVNFEIFGTDSVNTTLVSGSQSFDPAASDTFTPFEQLTEQDVLGWVKDKIGTDGVKAIYTVIDDKLKLLAANTSEVISEPSLPWAIV
jgi:hypothetical protein